MRSGATSNLLNSYGPRKIFDPLVSVCVCSKNIRRRITVLFDLHGEADLVPLSRRAS